MWLTVVPFVLVILAIFFIPGTLANLAAGFRASSAIAFAPLVSVALVGFAAVFWQLLGVGWGPIPIVLTTVIGALLLWVIRLVAQRRTRAGDVAADVAAKLPAGAAAVVVAEQANARSINTLPYALGGLLISAAVLGRDVVKIFQEPTHFSQTFDAVFHLSAVRWIAEHRMGSAIDMTMTSGDDPSGFYPLAWHDVVSAAMLTLRDIDPTRATTAMVLVVSAIIWPLGCLVFVRRLLPPTPMNQLTTGVFAASMTAFPFILIAFGVLYPNLLGLCLLPYFLALAVDILGLGKGPQAPLLTSWLAALAGIVALGLSHPNVVLLVTSVYGVALIAYWAVPTVWRATRNRSWTRQARFKAAGLGLWIAGATLAMVIVRPPSTAGRWVPKRSFLDAIIETIAVSPLEATIVLAVAAFTSLGVIAALVDRRWLLLLVLHLTTCFMWGIAAYFPEGPVRDALIGPWYNDPYRFAAMMPLTAVPLAVLGVDFMVQKIKFLQKPIFLALIPLLLLVTTQLDPGKQAVVQWAQNYYRIVPGGNLVSRDEYRLIQELPDIVGEDRVAVNPWNGSSMAYALVGTNTDLTHLLFDPTENQELLINNLNDMWIKPEVCQAVSEEQIKWVLDFSNHEIVNSLIAPYPGQFYLTEHSGFELVKSYGRARLYKVVGC